MPFLGLALREVGSVGVGVLFWAYGFLFFVAGWFGVNWLGLWGNGGLRRQMELRYRASGEGEDGERRWFVGFARPGKAGALDPHEDVGFLVLRSAEAVFFGSERRVEVPRGVLRVVRRRWNPHSALGLGGWVSLEGETGVVGGAGQAVRLLVEPRERGSLWGNRRLSGEMMRDIGVWLEE